MPDPLPVRQLDVHLAQPHLRAVIDRPLPERPPPARLITHRTSHAPTLTPSTFATTPRTTTQHHMPDYTQSVAELRLTRSSGAAVRRRALPPKARPAHAGPHPHGAQIQGKLICCRNQATAHGRLTRRPIVQVVAAASRPPYRRCAINAAKLGV